MTNIFDNVTVEQFKEYFKRDFPFLPIYDELKTYWAGDIVYFQGDFYKTLIDNTKDIDPTNQNYWQKFKGDIYNYVLDEDIEKAFTQAYPNANVNFGHTCNEKINIYLHLVAFYLVFDLKNSASGVNSSFTGTLSSKSVGDVSESYAIPNWMMQDPMYSIFASNGYGLKYLSLIAPYMALTLMFSKGGSTIG